MSENLKLEPNTLRNWMKEYLAAILGEPFEFIDPAANFFTFDIDSIDGVTMALEMEKAFNIEISPEIFLDGLTTIEEVITLLYRPVVEVK